MHHEGCMATPNRDGFGAIAPNRDGFGAIAPNLTWFGVQCEI